MSMDNQPRNYVSKFSLNRNLESDILCLLSRPEYTCSNNIYLAVGVPNPDVFPFESAVLSTKCGHTIEIDSGLMKSCLQYGDSDGYSDLVERLKLWMSRYHSITDWHTTSLAVTMGSTHALHLSLEIVLDAGDYLLAEEPLFGSIGDQIDAYGARYTSVETDDLGMKPEALRNAASRISLEGKEKMVLYVNHLTIARQHRAAELRNRLRQIYRISQDFDIFILEMDAAFFTTVAATDDQVVVSETLNHVSEEDVTDYSRRIFEQRIREREDVRSAAQGLLSGEVKWSLYPESPFLWFKVENFTQFLRALRRQPSSPSLALAYARPNQPNREVVTVGVPLLGSSEAHKKEDLNAIRRLLIDSGIGNE